MRRAFFAVMVSLAATPAPAQGNDPLPRDRTTYRSRDAYSESPERAHIQRGSVAGLRWAPLARPATPEPRKGAEPSALEAAFIPGPARAMEPKADPAALVAQGLALYGEGKYDEALVKYNQALKINGNDTTTLIHRANAYLDKGDHDRAIADCGQALDSEVPPETRAFALLVRGRAYFNKAEHNAAMADYMAALKLKPDYGDVFFYRGIAHYYNGELDPALGAFSSSLSLATRQGEAFMYRGAVHALKEDHDAALRDYEAAIAGAEKGTDTFIMAGALRLAGAGSGDEAIGEYTKIIERYPHYALAYHYRAAEYLKKGEYQDALADYDAALRIRPAYVLALNDRGSAFRGLREYDKAVADYTEAARLNPGAARTFFNRGAAYFEKGEYQRAIADFETALALNPAYPEAEANLQNAHDAKATADAADPK